MIKKQQPQLILGESFLYDNLPKVVLYDLNTLIDWRPFQKS
jgi:hypothetical protein